MKIYSLEESNLTDKEIRSLFEEAGSMLPVALSERVNISEYMEKLNDNGQIYIAINDNLKPVGLMAFYANDFCTYTAYLSIISVLTKGRGKGIASAFMDTLISDCKKKGMKKIALDVAENNTIAINLYKKFNFDIAFKLKEKFRMIADL